MAIDIKTEDLVALRKAAATLPIRPHNSTVFRWYKRGVRGHRLEVVVLGGRVYTSEQALSRFIAAISGAASTGPADPLTPSSTAFAQSAKRLEDRGW